MTEYDSLVGDQRKEKTGYLHPKSGQFITHQECGAIGRAMKLLQESDFPTPESRRLATEAKRLLQKNHYYGAALRNNQSE